MINEDYEEDEGKNNKLKNNQKFLINKNEDDYEEEEDNEEYGEEEEFEDLTDIKTINLLQNEIDKKKNKY